MIAGRFPTWEATSGRDADGDRRVTDTGNPTGRDRELLRELFDAHYRRLCRFARRYLDSDPEAADTVQDVFVRVWVRRDRRPLAEIRPPYLFQAVRNEALNRVEADRSQEEALRSVSADSSGGPSGPEGRMRRKEIRRRIREAIEELPPRRREIFLMVRRDGLTYRETAEALDLSKSTVDTQMGRALRDLRDDLSDLLLDGT